nr:MATE family efflux transporter [Thermostichus vulcanus]
MGWLGEETLAAGALGTTPLAAHQMAIQTAAVAFAVVRGISYGATVQVGQQWGAANRPGTRAAGWAALALGSVFMLGVAAVFQWVDGGQVIAAGALRGLKDTRIPFLIGVLAYWGVGLPTGYWLGFGVGMGGFGLWWGLAIGLTVAAVILTVRFARLTR